jgi:hypothetical protein
MYLVESKGGAIVCMLFSLLFLGTWPTVMNLLERRGRLPQHTYLDYTIANLLAAVIIAFTFGQIGTDEPNFLSQLSQVCVILCSFSREVYTNDSVLRVILNSAPDAFVKYVKKENKDKNNRDKITFYTFKILNTQFTI